MIFQRVCYGYDWIPDAESNRCFKHQLDTYNDVYESPGSKHVEITACAHCKGLFTPKDKRTKGNKDQRRTKNRHQSKKVFVFVRCELASIVAF